ncbi:glutamate-cysteine ligase family protein [Streptomyces katrae]|uniref:glutamate-cysteine ligase family protein n=1 Tax=Streptomyces katrae TaxID=68223 RepID=UPI003AEF6E56
MEGPHPVRGRAAPFEEEGDPTQSFVRIHASSVGPGCVRRRSTTAAPRRRVVVPATNGTPLQKVNHPPPLRRGRTAPARSPQPASRRPFAVATPPLASAAEVHGCRMAATGAAPVRGTSAGPVTREPGYLRMAGEALQLVDEQLICRMHVHVGSPRADTGVAVLNRIRPWRRRVRAHAAHRECSSPFSQGHEPVDA